ncbi:MAG: SufE family protein [Alphaproteobacteria bacterium]|nr:SufE family protein [Alphaproteobacteria bacterium]MBO6629843.1 SufE family protein [Alphaproteobacteria bacterium]MDF1625761.1 SufE family protein [Parvibaculaceae bacterium]|tara:strand:+ start:23 stop:445 length:423 start_codon:yes stop_codon:yes gene_type:complete
MSIQELIDDFSYLDDWEDRYKYVIELGKQLAPLTAEEHNAETKVQGCVSQVWLVCDTIDQGQKLVFRGDSDALIVRGLVAILLTMYSDKSPAEILDVDARTIFEQLGLNEHLSPQRSNGLHAMVARVREDAARTIATHTA